jgi:hypothetical protein
MMRVKIEGDDLTGPTGGWVVIGGNAMLKTWQKYTLSATTHRPTKK